MRPLAGSDPLERRTALEERLPGFAERYPFVSRAHATPAGALHFVDEGPREERAILMVHGNPTWSWFYRRLIDALRPTRRVLAADHLGMGLSDKPRAFSYRLADHVENLVALIDAQGVRRLDLVVHDWGGAIGMGLARRRPNIVDRLVILNTAAFRSERMPLRIRACRTPLLGAFATERLNLFTRAAMRMGLARSEHLDDIDRAAYVLPLHGNARATGRFVHDIPMNGKHPSIAELVAIETALPRFRSLPATIVWGEQDFCFTPHFRERWQGFLPAAEVHPLEEAGHLVLEDEPEECLTIITEFLDRTEAELPRPIPASGAVHP